MRIVIFGAKYKNDLASFRKQCKQLLLQNGVNTIDESYFKSTREKDIENPTIFRKVESAILKADAVVFELSRKSDGIGMIMGMAYANNKPSLILYNKEKRTIPFSSVALASTENNKNNVLDYTEDSLPDILKTFTKRVRDQKGVKFLTTLTAQQGKYLNWEVFSNGVKKVDIIRKLIDRAIEENKEYQKFLKED